MNRASRCAGAPLEWALTHCRPSLPAGTAPNAPVGILGRGGLEDAASQALAGRNGIERHRRREPKRARCPSRQGLFVGGRKRWWRRNQKGDWGRNLRHGVRASVRNRWAHSISRLIGQYDEMRHRSESHSTRYASLLLRWLHSGTDSRHRGDACPLGPKLFVGLRQEALAVVWTASSILRRWDEASVSAHIALQELLSAVPVDFGIGLFVRANV